MRQAEILIVEDSQTQGEQLKQMLEESGYSVSLVSDGMQALTFLAERRPALIITDVVMPDMDGFDMCDNVKRDPELREIPVMLLTGLAEADDVIKALQCGADNYISKPYNEDYLLARIDDLIAARAMGKAEGVQVGIKFQFAGTMQTISSDRKQILDVLISTFENAVLQNRMLTAAQNDLKRLNAELKQQARELLEAKEATSAANAAKNEFLASVSHQGRNVVDSIRDGADVLLGMINDILDVSKIETGNLELERAPFNLRESLETSIGSLAPSAAEKGLGLSFKMDPASPSTIIGDAVRLRHILVSLISNAVKFTFKGEVTLSLSATRLAVDPLRFELLFAVTDTGVGISQDRMDHVFRSFSRVDSSSTGRHGGTGSGLAISKRLCELMGGRMWAESEEGKGSTFYFSLESDAIPSADESDIALPARSELLLV